MRRVLHVKMVSQCAMLEEFGIFLVLADKVLSFILSPGFQPDFTCFLVAICISYRGIGSNTTAEPTRPTTSCTSEAQRDQRRAILQCWCAAGPYAHHLYEEERSAFISQQHSIRFSYLFIQLESIFRVLEPVGDKINERVKAPIGFGSRLGFRSAKSEWFRVYRDFFLPTEAFDLIFLKARIVVLCAKGFEIMDLNE